MTMREISQGLSRPAGEQSIAEHMNRTQETIGPIGCAGEYCPGKIRLRG